MSKGLKEMDTLTDERLIEEFLQGSENVFEVLIARYENELYEYALNLTGEPLDAEAVVQEVFARSFHAMHKPATKQSFKTYLFSLAVTVTLDMAHERATDNARLMADLRDVHEEISRRDQTALEAFAQPKQQALEAAIDALPTELWQVFYLVDQLGFSKTQVASITTTTVADVRERLYRARLELRSAMEDATITTATPFEKRANDLTSLLPM